MSNVLKQNVKSAELIGIGYYYKQDKRNGFSWQQLEGEELWDHTYHQHLLIEQCFQDEMKLLEIGNHQDAKTLLEFQTLTVKRCESLIDMFHNMIGFPNGKPMEQTFMNVELDAEKLRIISLINIQIYYLSQWNMIPNDEYNGMNYVYGNIEFV